MHLQQHLQNFFDCLDPKSVPETSMKFTEFKYPGSTTITRAKNHLKILTGWIVKKNYDPVKFTPKTKQKRLLSHNAGF